jgi:hypothetical protein
MPNATILLAWNTCYNYEQKLNSPTDTAMCEFYMERIVSNAEFGVRLCNINLKYSSSQLVKNYKSVFERLIKLYADN